MKNSLVLGLFLIGGFALSAQPARDMTAVEVAYANKISNALLASLPKEFKGWDVQFPSYTQAEVGTTRCSNCGYGKDCFWNFAFHAVYDGTTQAGPDLDKFRDSMKNIQYDWHYVALMTRYTNSHQLVVDISVNDSRMIGDFRYCGPLGFKSLPAPAGFDHYIAGSILSCFPQDAKRDLPEFNLFTIRQVPKITDQGHPGDNNGVVFYTLENNLPTPYKIQNLTLKITGSKALAKEFIESMNLAELKKIL